MSEHVLSFPLWLRGQALAHTEGTRKRRMSVRRMELDSELVADVNRLDRRPREGSRTYGRV